MTDQSQNKPEPSQWAKDADAKIRSAIIRGERKPNWYWEDTSVQQRCVLTWIDEAIYAATAQLREENERLKAKSREQNACIRNLRDNLADADRSHGECMKRITELEGIAKGLEDLTIKKDQRIAQLEALLDRVPHDHGNAPVPKSLAMDEETDWSCVYFKDCPRCAWEALKTQPTSPT